MAKEICVKTSRGLVCSPTAFARKPCGLPEICIDPFEGMEFPNEVTSFPHAVTLIGIMVAALTHGGKTEGLVEKAELLCRIARLLLDPCVKANDHLIFTVLEEPPAAP